ncbi:MAG TPA: hypothetical protein VMS31_05890, partial [Pyrinomonadaceae bacterium]|nr:hypothetical protein [Pyrinomonadaceae bacterium]
LQAKTLLIILISAVSVGVLASSRVVEFVDKGPRLSTIDKRQAPGYSPAPAPQTSAVPQRFRLDSSQSKFIAHALRGGLLWFKGHEHLVAAREFSGEAVITPSQIRPASLQLTVRTESMVETSDAFTEPQKEIINRELREIVLEPEKYPEIVFKSTDVEESRSPMANMP